MSSPSIDKKTINNVLNKESNKPITKKTKKKRKSLAIKNY